MEEPHREIRCGSSGIHPILQTVMISARPDAGISRQNILYYCFVSGSRMVG